MENALKRLRALQQELEDLHRTTARVLAESERLIGEMETPHGAAVMIPRPRVRVARKPSPSAPPRKRAR